MTTALAEAPPRRLGLVVARTDAWPLALGLAHAALLQRADVRIFAMDLAVAADALAANGVALRTLVEDGAYVAFCATSLDQHHSVPPVGVEIGSQLDHARLLQWATRVVALT